MQRRATIDGGTIIIGILVLIFVLSVLPPGQAAVEEKRMATTETATLAAGCFWCVEAVFQDLNGVLSVVSGYSGGMIEGPSYQQVSTGRSGHAEVVRITFNPETISFRELLDVFWISHDPTTLNRQGADVGTQYRSAIFYHSGEQRRVAEESRAAAEAAGLWPDPIVTEISELKAFYPAEEYHQDYFRRNPDKAYCRVVIAPKVDKVRGRFKAKLKD